MSKKKVDFMPEPESEVLEPVEEIKEAEKPEAVCYIGPTIPDVVIHGTIYKDGMPEFVGKVATAAFKALFIPVSQLPATDKHFVAALSKAVRKEA